MIVTIKPDWPAMAGVRACTSLRVGGISEGPFRSLNLGDHVGDNPEHVAENRRRLQRYLELPGEPRWLQQVHGTDVARLEAEVAAVPHRADACVTPRPGVVCAILTADCLPVLFAAPQEGVVAAAHAGWRGLCAGVLEQTVAAMRCDPRKISAWLGPAIGPQAFEVGEEVREAFQAHDLQAAACFRPSRPGHWLADLYALARLRLAAVGLKHLYGGNHCTYTESGQFFSYRRDGQTGRMASLIWLEPQD